MIELLLEVRNRQMLLFEKGVVKLTGEALGFADREKGRQHFALSRSDTVNALFRRNNENKYWESLGPTKTRIDQGRVRSITILVIGLRRSN